MNLIKANVQRNVAKIDEVITDITNIRWGFQKAIEIKSGIITLEEAMKEQEAMNAQAPQVSQAPQIPQDGEGTNNAG